MSAKNNDSLFGPIKQAYQWWMLMIGVLLLVLGYVTPIFIGCVETYNTTTPAWIVFTLKIFQVSGEIITIGAIVGFLSVHSIVKSSYKNELIDIFYEKKHLQTINKDKIENLWERISKIMFKSKFPEIHDRILNDVKNTYFPGNDIISYYDDYTITIDLTWEDKPNGMVRVIEKVEFDVITDSKSSFPFIQTNKLNVKGLQEGAYSVAIQMTVDGEDYCDISQELQADGCYFTEAKVELSGKNKYHIIKYQEKCYSIKTDYDISFRARYITNEMNVTLHHPEDIEVCFMDRGTTTDFRVVSKTKNYCNYRIKELILPRQGYTFILQPKT